MDQSDTPLTPHATSPFGRGWIPMERDIGIPGEDRVIGSGVVIDAAHPHPLPQAGGEQNHNSWTVERKVRFLAFLAENGRVRHAAARVGMSFQSAYVLRRRDPAFAQGWDAALVQAQLHAEQVLADRALEGTLETVWYHGEVVGHRRRYCSRQLLAHLDRLDKRTRAVATPADTFDDYLAALLAGEADPGEHAPKPRITPGYVPAHDPRADAIAQAIRAAEAEVYDREDDIREDAAATLAEETGLAIAREDTEPALVEALRAAARTARREAAAAWDAAFAERVAPVDALAALDDLAGMEIEGPVEFKSLEASIASTCWVGEEEGASGGQGTRSLGSRYLYSGATEVLGEGESGGCPAGYRPSGVAFGSRRVLAQPLRYTRRAAAGKPVALTKDQPRRPNPKKLLGSKGPSPLAAGGNPFKSYPRPDRNPQSGPRHPRSRLTRAPGCR